MQTIKTLFGLLLYQIVLSEEKCYLPIKDDNGWSDITASDFFMYKGKHYFAYRDYKNIYIYEGKFQNKKGALSSFSYIQHHILPTSLP